MSQSDLSEATGIPKGRINNWEQGKGSPKAKDTEILLSLLNKSNSEQMAVTTEMYIRELQERIKELQERINELKESHDLLKGLLAECKAQKK